MCVNCIWELLYHRILSIQRAYQKKNPLSRHREQFKHHRLADQRVFHRMSHCFMSTSSILVTIPNGNMNGIRFVVFCLFVFVSTTITRSDQQFLSLTQFNDAACTSVTSILTFTLNEESTTSCFLAGVDTFAMMTLTVPSFSGSVNNITQLRLSYYQDAQCQSPAAVSDQLQQIQYFNFPASDRSNKDDMKSTTQTRSRRQSCVADSTVSGVYWNVQLKSTSPSSSVEVGGSEYGLLIQV